MCSLLKFIVSSTYFLIVPYSGGLVDDKMRLQILIFVLDLSKSNAILRFACVILYDRTDASMLINTTVPN